MDQETSRKYKQIIKRVQEKLGVDDIEFMLKDKCNCIDSKHDIVSGKHKINDIGNRLY